MANAKHAYVFFNCDEEKTQKTMNIFYNKTIYQGTKKARKELLAKVEEEVKAGRINVIDDNMDAVSTAIMEGEPTNASKYIQYGAIESFPIV
ncbi:hypothetical protein SELR_01470 [Selenomonas ruminantium subsp. lactilytica TAM6421]|uniref:Uncharacterized protein n=2 Tax=Selenomonas ruminantium TaxID=971 RepID=A0A1H0STJ1_SELRU|nr:hypothetical protein [Selenomonas ruminantium]BAL81855.1 hypothetical protein SELR_01470 [Selenomonas ruminantium subsp. lactilytica TAM6421]SDP44566.1 hypothetical protein SAMN05216366_11947 [Selenomonas ruminantium]